MKRRAASLACAVALAVAGCKTVHPEGDPDGTQDVPLALWPAVGQVVDAKGRPARPSPGPRLRDALARTGIRAAVDAGGVSVPRADVDRAWEVLVTDPSLADTGAVVVIAAPAGTGRRVDGGILVPLRRPSYTWLPVTRPAATRPAATRPAAD
ncbi:MAG: hypothetical protein JWO31_420 [Phycisphaerales bacterium]|nr:hypothetical protein [Phycisphaerales bacterium]